MRRIFLEKTPSTNTFLKEICKEGGTHGLVVYTWNQMSGYGRRGKFWHSESDSNIAFSIALKPPPNADMPMSIVAGVAVRNAVLAFIAPKATLKIGIKWPNDIMVLNRKLCGISCEGVGNFLVLGIGINVNNTEFPGDLSRTATSLRLETGIKWDTHLLLNDVINSLLNSYDMLISGGFAPILQEFKQSCVNLGHESIIMQENRQISGIAVDIDNTGRIILQTDNKNYEAFSSGEVSLRSVEAGRQNVTGS